MYVTAEVRFVHAYNSPLMHLFRIGTRNEKPHSVTFESNFCPTSNRSDASLKVGFEFQNQAAHLRIVSVTTKAKPRLGMTLKPLRLPNGQIWWPSSTSLFNARALPLQAFTRTTFLYPTNLCVLPLFHSTRGYLGCVLTGAVLTRRV
jgi:hypothetical protein